jgi:hypothetical protein
MAKIRGKIRDRKRETKETGVKLRTYNLEQVSHPGSLCPMQPYAPWLT